MGSLIGMIVALGVIAALAGVALWFTYKIVAWLLNLLLVRPLKGVARMFGFGRKSDVIYDNGAGDPITEVGVRQGVRNGMIDELDTLIAYLNQEGEETAAERVLAVAKDEMRRSGSSTGKNAAKLAGVGLAGLALGYALHNPNRRFSIFKD